MDIFWEKAAYSVDHMFSLYFEYSICTIEPTVCLVFFQLVLKMLGSIALQLAHYENESYLT